MEFKYTVDRIIQKLNYMVTHGWQEFLCIHSRRTWCYSSL